MKQMDNRQLIMEKALELFCARGYDAVGVQEIAEQSGITKPTLYYYFGSKQGLMETILEENSHILEEDAGKGGGRTWGCPAGAIPCGESVF